MPRVAYVNEQAGEAMVVIQPWAHATRVAPGGQIDIVFDTKGISDPEIRIAHRGDEVEIVLRVNLVSISGDGVEGFKLAEG
ncbi:hypothetical protein [Phenylobacterium sp.]|uniref:hypothetical protein n=1 Tax=Phenylobacterium sp. TaxID=1871053 RepID=UPI003BAA3D65